MASSISEESLRDSYSEARSSVSMINTLRRLARSSEVGKILARSWACLMRAERLDVTPDSPDREFARVEDRVVISEALVKRVYCSSISEMDSLEGFIASILLSWVWVNSSSSSES